MKIKFIIILSFFTTHVYSQSGVGINNGYNTLVESAVQISNNRQLASAYVINTPNERIGSYYLFKNWKNICIINTTDGNYKIQNGNINIKDQRFESKFGKDSIFSFNLTNINFIIINNRKFVKVQENNYKKNKIYEVIYEDENKNLLKEYYIELKKGEIDPLMIKPTRDKYITRTQYFLSEDEKFNKIKLNKKNLNNAFEASKKNSVKSYVKKHKLSYRKENDVRKILTFSSD